jgi:hypothetical protein
MDAGHALATAERAARGGAERREDAAPASRAGGKWKRDRTPPAESAPPPRDIDACRGCAVNAH